jgi:hypothetical protein
LGRLDLNGFTTGDGILFSRSLDLDRDRDRDLRSGDKSRCWCLTDEMVASDTVAGDTVDGDTCTMDVPDITNGGAETIKESDFVSLSNDTGFFTSHN